MAFNSQSGYRKVAQSQKDDEDDDSNKIYRTIKTLEFHNPGKKNMVETQGRRVIKKRNNFDSLNSERPLYDEKGLLISSGQDICDCLRDNCPGCHFPCKQCKSTKCGNKCRVNRNWYFEKVEIEGISKCLEMKIPTV